MASLKNYVFPDPGQHSGGSDYRTGRATNPGSNLGHSNRYRQGVYASESEPCWAGVWHMGTSQAMPPAMALTVHCPSFQAAPKTSGLYRLARSRRRLKRWRPPGLLGRPRWALRFLVLTTARSGEVRGATWGEVDLEAREWRIPADRMKGHAEHRVPLSSAALAVLEQARGA